MSTPSSSNSSSEAQRAGVILLGASEFPKFPGRGKDNPSFARSAKAAHEVLTEQGSVLGNPPIVLDLFDDDAPANLQIGRVHNFLATHEDLTDVVLYYCGHGDFLIDRSYVLVVKDTDPEDMPYTALKLLYAHGRWDRHLALKRTYLVLDCCFAGQALNDLKEHQNTTAPKYIDEQVFKSFSRRGTALIAAASAQDVAIAPRGQELTMFSDGLVHAIRNGVAEFGPSLSFYEIVAAAKKHITAAHGAASVVPEVHSVRGEVTDRPFFANRAYVTPESQTRDRDGYKAAVASLRDESTAVRRDALDRLVQLYRSTRIPELRLDVIATFIDASKKDDSDAIKAKAHAIVAQLVDGAELKAVQAAIAARNAPAAPATEPSAPAPRKTKLVDVAKFVDATETVGKAAEPPPAATKPKPPIEPGIKVDPPRMKTTTIVPPAPKKRWPLWLRIIVWIVVLYVGLLVVGGIVSSMRP